MRRRFSRRAVAGFFEEFPVLMVVLAALLIFLATAVSAFENLSQKQQSSQFSQEAQTLLQAVLGYQNLTYQNQQGLFQSTKVVNLTYTNISYDLHPPSGYEIQILDLSAYHTHYNRTVDSCKQSYSSGRYPACIPGPGVHLSYGVYAAQAPVSLLVTDQEYHDALVVVTVWS
ncbi:MAG: hypothetical protein M1144_03655 [Candidatus Thermoplasmatota archaeon]|nr:hypothetical protein [Candidatus Thermoplasmatota archaeon]MCL5984860.1 hypothetical protein [Candidatus Thermoplasmatota archaeon]